MKLLEQEIAQLKDKVTEELKEKFSMDLLTKSRKRLKKNKSKRWVAVHEELEAMEHHLRT